LSCAEHTTRAAAIKPGMVPCRIVWPHVVARSGSRRMYATGGTPLAAARAANREMISG
jgi:hypothetical protein